MKMNLNDQAFNNLKVLTHEEKQLVNGGWGPVCIRVGAALLVNIVAGSRTANAPGLPRPQGGELPDIKPSATYIHPCDAV